MSDSGIPQQATAGWDAQVRAFALAVTSGNDADAARWPESEWRASARATAALRREGGAFGGSAMEPNEVVPEWLREKISGRLTARGYDPVPSICTLWTEHLNWFALAGQHPDELVVTVATPDGWPEFDVDQFQAVWDNTQDDGAVPLMTIVLHPKAGADGLTFAAEIQGFYIVTPDGSPSLDEHASSILNMSPCTRSILTPVTDADLLSATRALRGDPQLEARVTAWDWLWGTSNSLDPAGPADRRRT